MVWTRGGSNSSRSADRYGYLIVVASPDDKSILYMQDQHRSDDIWSGEVR
jgi:hypothetical protein